MNLRFGATLTGLLPGSFGHQSDTEARQAYRNLAHVFQDPIVRPLITETPDTYQAHLSVNPYNHTITIDTSLPGVPQQLQGRLPKLSLSFTDIPNAVERLAQFLNHNFKMFNSIESLQKSLAQKAEKLSCSGLSLAELNTGFGKGEKINIHTLKTAKQLNQLLSDKELQQAMRQYLPYKTHKIGLTFEEQNFEQYLKRYGLTPEDVDPFRETADLNLKEKIAKSNAYEAAARNYHAFERLVPGNITVRFDFNHLPNLWHHFDVDSVYEALDKSLEERISAVNKWVDETRFLDNQLTVSFTADELKNKPSIVKQRLLEACNFWNTKLSAYIGSEEA